MQNTQDIPPSQAMRPGEALKHHIKEMTEYEHGEILDYKNIYFLGLKAVKISGSILQENFGYDDDRGNY